MNIFLAGSSRDMPKVLETMERIKQLGHNFFDWTFDLEKDLTSTESEMAAMDDLRALRQSDAVIWMVDPKHPSHGAPFEVGVAYGLEKNIVCFWSGETIDFKLIYAHSVFEGFGDIDSCVGFLEQNQEIETSWT